MNHIQLVILAALHGLKHWKKENICSCCDHLMCHTCEFHIQALWTIARRMAYSELHLEIRTISAANASWIIRLDVLHLQLLSRVGLISDTVSCRVNYRRKFIINQ